MNTNELHDLYEEHGYGIALAVLEDAQLPRDEEYRLQEALGAWDLERHRRWTRRRVCGAFDPHEF